MIRPQLEAFIRRSWYSVLPVLDTTERCRVKKAVVVMTELQGRPTCYDRDEGSYQLSHAYDRFLDTASFSRVKNRKK